MTRIVSNVKPRKLPDDLTTEMVCNTLNRRRFTENESAMLAGYRHSKLLDVTSVSL